MKKNLSIFLLSTMPAAGTQALAAAPGPSGPLDDDLGIEKKMKEEAADKKKKKVVKKEDLPPINMVRVKGGCYDMGDWTGNGDEDELPGGFSRLPTEAEWEFAAREGGKQIVWAGTNNEGDLGSYAVFSDNSDMIGPVKSKKTTGLGL